MCVAIRVGLTLCEPLFGQISKVLLTSAHSYMIMSAKRLNQGDQGSITNLEYVLQYMLSCKSEGIFFRPQFDQNSRFFQCVILKNKKLEGK